MRRYNEAGTTIFLPAHRYYRKRVSDPIRPTSTRRVELGNGVTDRSRLNRVSHPSSGGRKCRREDLKGEGKKGREEKERHGAVKSKRGRKR